ncbi:hypothetical protein PIB30_005923 [Stylosanthes scabra]|uniref:Uncharacterized protein n=1 Tax=Stylosanthes scabra TaxID=79078 RepID=A0ABU6R5C6_9FABA|nr:hypothetical protein [Stylosanthes scabra]
MPIYHDYHGDSKSSSILTWDQIQISLKCLLPTYEPVLCDSPVVLSFLSTQQICADFTQTCANIIANMNEFKTENSDPTIHVHIQPDQDSANQNSEYYIREEATIQKALDTNLSTIHQSNPEIPSEIHEGKIEAQYSDSTIIEFENGATQISEFTSTTTPYLNPGTNRSQFKSQNVEDEEEWDARRLYLGSADWNAAVEVQRPPPEPPDLKSLVEDLFAMQSPACQNMIEVTENEYGTHSDAENGAIAKGKVEEEVNQPPPNPPDLPSHAKVLEGAKDAVDLDRSGSTKEEEVVALTNCGDDAGDDGTTRSAEVGVSAEDNRASELLTRVTKVRGSGLVRRTPSLVAKPRLLLAAVLPWDRERRSNTEEKSDRGWVADQAFDGGADRAVFPGVQALEGYNVLSRICRRLCTAKQKQQVTAEAGKQGSRETLGDSFVWILRGCGKGNC